MDLQKTKILLDKINALYSNMSADRNHISIIERDLMKSYILQFYESFLETENHSHRSAVEVFKSSPKVTVDKPAEVIQKINTPPPPPLSRETIAKPVEQKTPTQPPPVVEPPQVEEPKAEVPKPEPEPIQVKAATPSFVASPELEDLFAFSSAKELSEKLGESPITDIKKSMGLNERIFTMNELFGGDKAVFDLTLDTLNTLSDFNQAKTFLMRNAASKYNWTDKGRVSKAKTFIKLVKRRYNGV